MKFLLVCFLLIGSNSFADTIDALNECKVICSQKCILFAEELKTQVNQALEACEGNGTNQAAIISACTNAGFSYQSDVTTCIKNAKNPNSVRACAAAGFSYRSDIQECIVNIGSKESEIVGACKSVGFSNQSQVKTCISTASYASVVRACAKVGYSYQSQILECIAK